MWELGPQFFDSSNADLHVCGGVHPDALSKPGSGGKKLVQGHRVGCLCGSGNAVVVTSPLPGVPSAAAL